jgi:predicted DNA-binding WGR domain protein
MTFLTRTEATRNVNRFYIVQNHGSLLLIAIIGQ